MLSLLAYSLEPAYLVIAVLLLLVMVGVGLLYHRTDERIEARRRKAIDLAQKLSGVGFKDIPEVLNCYAVGDYDGVWKQIDILWSKYTDKDTADATLSAFLTRLLDDALADPERAPRVLKVVEDYQLLVAAKVAKQKEELASK